jgi:2-C-methyl-D-erythritol 4-phosphate cytidylyltransferase
VTDVSAVVVAAGSGERLGPAGGDRPKALVEVAGTTLLELALTSLRAVPEIVEVVIVHPPGEAEAFRDVVGPEPILVPGGETRTDSARAGIAACAETTLVAIHDAARALVPPAVLSRTIAAVSGDVIAAAPGLPVADTLKRVSPDGEVLATVDRDGLWQVHTPQVIRHDVLTVLIGGISEETTDDLGLVEAGVAAGLVDGRIVIVPGDPRDLKVTYPEDLHVAAALVRGAAPSSAAGA